MRCLVYHGRIKRWIASQPSFLCVQTMRLDGLDCKDGENLQW